MLLNGIFFQTIRGVTKKECLPWHMLDRKKKNNLEPDEKKSGLEASVLLMNYENLSRCIILSVELCLADRDWQKRDIIISL